MRCRWSCSCLSAGGPGGEGPSHPCPGSGLALRTEVGCGPARGAPEPAAGPGAACWGRGAGICGPLGASGGPDGTAHSARRRKSLFGSGACGGVREPGSQSEGAASRPRLRRQGTVAGTVLAGLEGERSCTARARGGGRWRGKAPAREQLKGA